MLVKALYIFTNIPYLTARGKVYYYTCYQQVVPNGTSTFNQRLLPLKVINFLCILSPRTTNPQESKTKSPLYPFAPNSAITNSNNSKNCPSVPSIDRRIQKLGAVTASYQSAPFSFAAVSAYPLYIS